MDFNASFETTGLRIIFSIRHTSICELIISEGPAIYRKKGIISRQGDRLGRDPVFIIKEQIRYEQIIGEPNSPDMLLNEYKYSGRRKYSDAFLNLMSPPHKIMNYKTMKTSRISNALEIKTNFGALVSWYSHFTSNYSKAHRNIAYESVYLVNYMLHKKELDTLTLFSRKFGRKTHYNYPLQSMDDFWLTVSKKWNIPCMMFTITKFTFNPYLPDPASRMTKECMNFDISDLQGALENKRTIIDCERAERLADVVDYPREVDKYVYAMNDYSQQSIGVNGLKFSSVFDAPNITGGISGIARARLDSTICNFKHASPLHIAVCYHEGWITNTCFEYYRGKFPEWLSRILSNCVGIHLNTGLTKLITMYYV